MGFRYSVARCSAFCVCVLVLISTAQSVSCGRNIHFLNENENNKKHSSFSQSGRMSKGLPTLEHFKGSAYRPLYQRHRSASVSTQNLCKFTPNTCNLTNALETTYYAQFNYTGPIANGLTCYAIYKCDGNVQYRSPLCDPFVYYLLYMEAYELSIRGLGNSNNCNASAQPDPLWTPNSGIFNYKELVVHRNGTVTIRQRQRLKLFTEITKDQLIHTDYAKLNKIYPRSQLKKWSQHFYLYNGTEYANNGNEYTERELCLKVSNETWTCESNDHPNRTIRDSIPWHMKYFDLLSGYLRIQFFLDNKNINRTGYHGMDGDGWNVTDTIITGELAGKTNWQNDGKERILFFDKLWVEACRCENHLQPNENKSTKCEHWNLMKRNFEIPFKPVGLSFCPNMDQLNISADAFNELS